MRLGGIRRGIGRPRGIKNKKPPPVVDLDDSEVMTLRQVADYLNCHYTTAHRLANQREIPGRQLGPGGDWRFLKSELDQWIAQGGGRL